MDLEKYRQYLIDTICDIMIKYGPDGHCDGADYIAEFVLSLTIGMQDEWIKIHLKSEDETN